MKREKKTKAGAAIVTFVGMMFLMVPCTLAGSLIPLDGPVGPQSSTMPSLQNIYDVCAGNCPNSGYDNCDGVPVAKAGQTISYGDRDDGELEVGVDWPSPRFIDNSDGTVTDNMTGLIWLKNANCFGVGKTWNEALASCNGLDNGTCGLTDGSAAGDWRLPNLKELYSLIDIRNSDPALPTGHPFTNVMSSYYWSSSSNSNGGNAWIVYFIFGEVLMSPKNITDYKYVWPVRGGND